jgi:uncharacterized protein (DUF58 family)
MSRRIELSSLRRQSVVARRRVVNVWVAAVEWAADRTVNVRARVRPVTSVVTPTAWVALALALVALPMSLVLGWAELAAAAWFVAALGTVCVVFVLGTHQLAARLDLGRDRIVVGEDAHGTLALTNESRQRTLPLLIELAVGTGKTGFELPTLAAGAGHEDLFRIPTTRRAVLAVGPVRAVRADPIGLLRREQDLTEEQTLYVHPRTVAVEGSASGIMRDLEGRTVRKLSDNDVAFHALRGYVPGDDRRFIHWKSSARTGTLMVRQFEETRRSHVLIATSTRLDDYATDDEFELAISVAGSLGVQALADDQTLTAVTSTRQLRKGTPRHLLDQLSGVEYERQAPALATVARRLAREETGASVAIFVCGSIVDPAEIRRARRYMPPDVRTIVVRADIDADAEVRQMGDLDLVNLGRLDDLGPTIRRLVT